MAKIDVTKFEGYANMTPEEKVALLESFEYDDNASELERYKNAASKANSEAAEWKKKHNALLGEEEQKKQATDEELTALRERVAEMEKKELLAQHKAQFLALGYDESLADSTAKALVDGDTAKVFAAQKKFLESHDKALKADLLKGTPTPPAGEGGETMTLDKLRKMSVQERHEYSVNNPTEYKKLYGGNF
jgi:hypothetical protein